LVGLSIDSGSIARAIAWDKSIKTSSFWARERGVLQHGFPERAGGVEQQQVLPVPEMIEGAFHPRVSTSRPAAGGKTFDRNRAIRPRRHPFRVHIPSAGGYLSPSPRFAEQSDHDAPGSSQNSLFD
jgi:hypothetical protein